MVSNKEYRNHLLKKRRKLFRYFGIGYFHHGTDGPGAKPRYERQSNQGESQAPSGICSESDEIEKDKKRQALQPVRQQAIGANC